MKELMVHSLNQPLIKTQESGQKSGVSPECKCVPSPVTAIHFMSTSVALAGESATK